MITPFHFACYCEERLRAQFEVLDKPLGDFVQILRRFTLTENRAALQFCAQPTAGEDLVPHVTFNIQRVPQKDEKTALNCVLTCPSQKLQKNFRVLILRPEEAETYILKALDFLQKAFLPLNYTTATPRAASEIVNENAALETAKALMNAAGKSADAKASAAETTAVDDPLTDEAKALTHGKKYIIEDTGKGEAVRMRTHDGKYVPDGALPAVIRVNK